jgi:KUP system potassium uptake protein
MRADNHGEGGIMALLALVPAPLRTLRAGRISVVALCALAGAALLFGDGMITPAISVLSAVEGLKLASPGLERYVVPLTVAILVALFAMQKRGTGGLGKFFGPIMLAWFVTLAVLGIVQIAANPTILQALSPGPAIRYFVAHGWQGVRVLGGVVLVITGGEALYADMGHFGRVPIQRAWIFICFPAFLLNYLGQGALVLAHPEAAARPFYAMCPQGPWLYPFIILAAIATIIASQALISGVFSLTTQAMHLGFFPRVTIRHTSAEAEGQTYLPLLNWTIAAGCIILVIGFKASAGLAAAYGLAVSGTMLLTSLVFYMVARFHWKWSRLAAGAVLVAFLAIDIPFLVANSLKFFDGGYIPLLIGAFFFAMMVLWRMGRDHLAAHADARSAPMAPFLSRMEDKKIARLPGVAIIMASASQAAPPLLVRLVDRCGFAYETMILLTVIIDKVPTVAASARLTTERIAPTIQRAILRYGFMDSPLVHRAMPRVLTALEISVPAAEVVYVLGHERVRGGPGGEMNRVTESLFAVLARNARNATDYFELPPDQCLEIGVHIDL